MLHVFTGTLDKLLDFDNRENSLHRTRWRINVMSMRRNGSSVAWMTSTILRPRSEKGLDDYSTTK